jgi:vacuolar-type H+-ATPase subunit D/Vma8
MKITRSYRLSAETLGMIDEIIEKYSNTLAKVTATDVVEKAIQELYEKLIEGKRPL